MNLISIRELVKNYEKNCAVDKVSLEIEEGEFLVLLGPSGCGKTSILRCIAGLENVSDGEILIDGQVVSSKHLSVPPENRSTGMVFQSYALWPHKTVEQNVSFGLELKNTKYSEIKERVSEALSLVGLSEYAKRSISQLSGGQQQRVALARAVVLRPKVLLFDEPLSNLDAKLREHMRFELRQLQKLLGITTVYVTHDQQEAMVVADRIVLLKEGQINQISSPVEIYEQPSTLFGADFIGVANIQTGQVVSKAATTKVKISDDFEIECESFDFNVSEWVDAMFRPEQCIISTTPLEGINVWKGIIKKTFFLGNLTDVYFEIGSIELRAQISPPKQLFVGQTIWTHIQPNSIRMYRH